jgi:hypothetical protein
MNALLQTTDALTRCVERLIPRLLSQGCRDPNSVAHGAFDRDWWHYKIRDFPSVILQQGSYASWLAGQLEGQSENRTALSALAAAGCHFWNHRATGYRAFEEYYPWEEGYPPLAFSTLAVMKLAAAGVIEPARIEPGARVAAAQLRERFEGEAANQQVAGLAALAWLRRVFPDLCAEAEFRALVDRTLALQTPEGWFVEYGGPDLGYLSVTMDCLWDLFDATGDGRFVESAASALRCTGRYVYVMGAGIGMHNARNTDYILPYGIARFIVDGTEEQRGTAGRILQTLYTRVESPGHFIHAMDDRYLCHYMGHSLLRACRLLSAARPALEALPEPAPSGALEELAAQSGHYVCRREDGSALIVSLRKGGIFTWRAGTDYASDFGWMLEAEGRQYVSHWWSDQWTWTRTGSTFTIQGDLVPAQDHQSSPLKHLSLRAVTFCLGHRVIRHLKKYMIFRQFKSAYHLERRITCEPARITVKDRIVGVPTSGRMIDAGRSSKRHVASADTFHAEDLLRRRGITCRETTTLDGGVFSAERVYERREVI